MFYNPTALLVGALSVTVITGGAYIKGRQDGGAIARADQAEVAETVRKVREAALESAAAAISNIEVRHTTIRQQMEREVRENIVYRDCRNTALGLQRINAALVGHETGSPDGGKLPPADAPGR